MKKITFTYEDTNGAIIGPVRVHAIDRIKAEGTCRAQGWPWDDNPRAYALMGYYATQRASLHSADDFDQWMAALIDFSMDNDETENPTTPKPTPAKGGRARS